MDVLQGPVLNLWSGVPTEQHNFRRKTSRLDDLLSFPGNLQASVNKQLLQGDPLACVLRRAGVLVSPLHSLGLLVSAAECSVRLPFLPAFLLLAGVALEPYTKLW